jgi:DNA-binding PadR family transcriptional regulator
MALDVRITPAVALVATALLDDPGGDHYGLELMTATGLASGSLYPILQRLRKAGWVETRWEDLDPVAAGRPARRYYRLTAEGVTNAQKAAPSVRGRAPQAEVRPAW